MRVVRTHDGSVLVVGDADLRDLARRALPDGATLRGCDGVAAAIAMLEESPADVVMIGQPGAAILLEELRRERFDCDFVAICSDVPDALSGGESVRAVDVLTEPVHDAVLRRTLEQILVRRRLLEENRRLQDELHTAQACRVLGPCLEPGSVHPVALDLLLNGLSRSRGLAVFRRLSVPLHHAMAFRGFSDGEAASLRKLLVDDKPVDLDAFSELGPMGRGPVHEALTALGLPAPTLLAVPLLGQGDAGGVLFVFEDGRPFEAEELAKAQTIAAYAAAALENAERYQLAKERAFIDDVTEVYNARYLLAATDNELRRAERYGSSLSVLFLDLDRFKLVNDRHGHLVGSRTLRRLSQVLLQCVRQVDTLARYGGDEFTILLVDTNHEEALRIARRIRQTVEEHVFEASGDAQLRLTISIGVGTYPEHGSGREQLLDSADKAMYLAKSQGRNRVCSASELDDDDASQTS